MSVFGEPAPGVFQGRAWSPIVVPLLWTLVVSAFFLAFPGVDIWFTGLFYRPESGFFLGEDPVIVSFREFGQALTTIIALGALVSLVARLAIPRVRAVVPIRVAQFLLTSFLIGPGLIVNVILKNNWGRPRPRDVDLFGGSFPYVDVWHIASYCRSNCSFVAGEGSSSIWLLALVLVVPPAWRTRTFVVTAILGVLLSFNRIFVGAHFLSDVLISWGLTLAVVAVTYRLTLARHPVWIDIGAPDDASELAMRRMAASSLGRKVAIACLAVAVGIVGFAVAGQSTWTPEANTHEVIEWMGLILIVTASLGLAWHAWRYSRTSGETVAAAGTVGMLRVLGAAGVGAQFGSMAIAMAAGAAMFAFCAFRLAPGAGTQEVQPVRLAAGTPQGALLTAAALLLTLPLAEGIERLQMSGLLHVVVRLP